MQDYTPIYGKTYSLFGEGSTTGPFYRDLSSLTDELLGQYEQSEKRLLESVQSSSRNRRGLRRSRTIGRDSSADGHLLTRVHEVLSIYIGEVEKHVRSLGLYRYISDRDLFTSREQYYLYMIEFELLNRMHIQAFRKSNYRVALLPYCMKESHESCKAAPDEVDFRCRGCLKTCYINRVSNLLRQYDVNPYILSQGRVSLLLKELWARHGSIGVMGIACVAELIWGMRMCLKAGVPVIGIPLNANRCPRWMGRMHETSVDLDAIRDLLAGKGYA